MSTAEAPTRTAPAPMPIGGTVAAIVPQTFEEIQRVSVTIINAGIAPSSLVKFAANDASAADIEALGKRNVAAVATCIMAGAELGLPPMVSLRAFTVINGRPALYADGNIAVIRKAKDSEGKPICEYIRQGFEVGESDDLTFAWVEAKRRDNGETHREEFSIADAKQAGLWDDNPFKRANVWRNGKKDWYDDVPNDAVWFRYPRRMMMWRAAGYCLRWLFADVLGGMPDEYEAREIEDMVDITPPRTATRPAPPPVPEDEEGDPPSTEEPKPEPTPPKPSKARKPKAEAAPAAGSATPTQTGGQPTSSTGSNTDTSSGQSEGQPSTSSTAPETTVVENTATGEPMTVDTDTGQVFEDEEEDPAPPTTTPITPAVQQAIAQVEAEGDPGISEVGSPDWWESLEGWAKQATDIDALDEVFKNDFDVWSVLAGDEQATNDASAIYDREKARIENAAERKDLEEQGQQGLGFDDLPEDTKTAVKLGNTP